MKLHLLVALLCVLGGRASADEKPASKPDSRAKVYQHTVPEELKDGWETAPLDNVGLDADLIKVLLERIGDKTYKNIHSVLLVKDGKLVVEEYFPGQDQDGKDHDFKRDTLHTQQSVTKSVNSLLIGIAIDQKLIGGVEDKLSSYFPQYADLFKVGEKDSIRLKHCLSMSVGLAWDEGKYPYSDPRNDAASLRRSDDPIRSVLERPAVAAPGRKFTYHSGISITLGEIVHKVSGLPTNEFAERHLFGPLGISEYRWAKLPTGLTHTGGGLNLRPRDMAKIGSLMLNGGRWQGKQVVSEAWVRESTKQQVPYSGYGYQWWLRSFRGRDRAIDAFSANGRGGQFIIVVPDLNMVAVFTGWNDNALSGQPFDMMQRFVVPAVGRP